MKQEDKILLLQDLCARIPYNVRMHEINPINNIQLEIFLGSVTCESSIAVKTKNKGIMCGAIEEFKPYLFPLSSMTDTQREEYESLCIKETSECIDISGFYYTKDNYYDTVESIDYLYKNHIDIRGLIPKGLAIDCTNLNIY